MLCPKVAFCLIINIFTNFQPLSQTTINIFDSPLTLPIIYDHFNLDDFVLEKYEFVHISLDSNVIGGCHACATPFAGH